MSDVRGVKDQIFQLGPSWDQVHDKVSDEVWKKSRDRLVFMFVSQVKIQIMNQVATWSHSQSQGPKK